MTFFEKFKLRVKALKNDTQALFYAYRDPRTPWYAKVLAAVVVAYAFSPVDLVPDFVPVLGYLDDLILIPAGVALVLKLVPPEVMADARLKASQAETGGKKNWIAGAVILAVWAVLLFFVGRWVYGLLKK